MIIGVGDGRAIIVGDLFIDLFLFSFLCPVMLNIQADVDGAFPPCHIGKEAVSTAKVEYGAFCDMCVLVEEQRLLWADEGEKGWPVGEVVGDVVVEKVCVCHEKLRMDNYELRMCSDFIIQIPGLLYRIHLKLQQSRYTITTMEQPNRQSKQRTVLFIDGSNLYAGQYDLFGPEAYLNFPVFIAKVEQKLQTTFKAIYVYASYSPRPTEPTDKQKTYLKNESLFFKRVRGTQRVIFFKGYRSPTSGKEKEVDVKLAADMVHKSHLNEFDQLYLMTGDADFLQALLLIETLHKGIKLICLENKIMHKGLYRFSTLILQSNSIIKKGYKSKLITYLFLPKTAICISIQQGL